MVEINRKKEKDKYNMSTLPNAVLIFNVPKVLLVLRSQKNI